MQNNKVFINDRGIIEIHVVGDQTRKSVSAMGDAVCKLVQELNEANKPVLVLDVLYEIGQVTPDGRREVVAIAKGVDFIRAAMVGKGGVLRMGANLLLQAVGKGDKIRYFEDRDKATEWLLK